MSQFIDAADNLKPHSGCRQDRDFDGPYPTPNPCARCYLYQDSCHPYGYCPLHTDWKLDAHRAAAEYRQTLEELNRKEENDVER